MANVAEKFGLRPYRKLDGTPLVGAQNRYTIASGYSDAIFQGEMVEPLGTGNSQRHGPNTSDAVIGVFNGCFYTDPTTQKPTYSNYYPGGIAADDIVANVIDDPNAVFEIQADAAFPVADLAGNYDILATAGDTVSGTSRIELEVGTADSTVATLPLKAIDISQDPENSDTSSANTNVIVKINNHLFSAGTAGLA